MFITYLNNWKILLNFWHSKNIWTLQKRALHSLFIFFIIKKKKNLWPDKTWGIEEVSKIWKPLDVFYSIGREILYTRCSIIHICMLVMYAQIFILLIRENCKDLFKLLLCAIFQEDTLSCKKIVITLFLGRTMTRIYRFCPKYYEAFFQSR